MKQYNTNQKKKIVEIINKVKNKKVQALKFNISIRTYYYWKKKLEETDSIENRSRKPKNSPHKLKNKKIINKIVEIRKKYKYGKTKIKKFLEKENIKIGTTAIETILKEYNLYQKKKRKIRKKHKGKHAIYIKEAGEKVQIDVLIFLNVCWNISHFAFIVFKQTMAQNLLTENFYLRKNTP